jgi:hypothetical protein
MLPGILRYHSVASRFSFEQLALLCGSIAIADLRRYLLAHEFTEHLDGRGYVTVSAFVSLAPESSNTRFQEALRPFLIVVRHGLYD